MKFTCLQENLNLGLQTTGHLSNKNINLPILNNVLLEVEEGTLKLSSTNLEIGISSRVRCKTEKTGSFTVEAKLLAEYINLLPNDQVEVELTENDFLNIACGSSKTKIKGISSEDFPVIPEIDRKDPYKISISEFKKAVSQVLFSVANSETRPEISGVYMNFNKLNPGQLVLVGTDSYRLAEKKIDLNDNKKEQEVIVPLKTLQEVLRILNNLKDQENIEIFLSENQILFVCNGIEIISRLVEGEYPDYQQIIPAETKTKVTVSSAELTAAIKKVALFSKAGIFDVNLSFEASSGLIVKAANTELGESQTDIDVEFSGESNETTLNFRYLLDGLANIEESEVEISLIDNNLPLMIKPKGKDDYIYIVMPIKQ